MRGSVRPKFRESNRKNELEQFKIMRRFTQARSQWRAAVCAQTRLSPFSDFEFRVILGAQLTELSDSALQAEMMRAPPSPADSPSAARTALVIDVHPEIHAMLQTFLDPVAWKVRHAPNNAAALTLAEASHFDLIITSDKTSGREDIDLLRKIRLVRPHTRLIILTDESATSYVIDSIREPAFSYFSKPFSLNSLSDMIQHAIDSPCWDDGIEIRSATPEWIRLVARCDLGTAERLVQFLHEIGDLPEWKATPWAQLFVKFC